MAENIPAHDGRKDRMQVPVFLQKYIRSACRSISHFPLQNNGPFPTFPQPLQNAADENVPPLQSMKTQMQLPETPLPLPLWKLSLIHI